MKKTCYLLLTLSIILTISGCRKNGHVEFDKLSKKDRENISKIEKDSVYIDENGNEIKLNFNEKIVDVDNALNGKVKYAYGYENGTYFYDSDGNISKVIYKEAYRNDLCNIYMRSDTIAVGDSLRTIIWANAEKYTVEFEAPEHRVVRGTRTQENLQSFICTAEGRHTFKGIIVTDSITFPFEYNFLVVQKK